MLLLLGGMEEPAKPPSIVFGLQEPPKEPSVLDEEREKHKQR